MGQIKIDLTTKYDIDDIVEFNNGKFGVIEQVQINQVRFATYYCYKVQSNDSLITVNEHEIKRTVGKYTEPKEQ